MIPLQCVLKMWGLFNSHHAKMPDKSDKTAIRQFLLQAANSGYGVDHHSGYGVDHHTSGYGGDIHSGYGHHTGYGHDDGYDRYGSHSGYGHEDCCPPVIDPLTLISLLGNQFLKI